MSKAVAVPRAYTPPHLFYTHVWHTCIQAEVLVVIKLGRMGLAPPARVVMKTFRRNHGEERKMSFEQLQALLLVVGPGRSSASKKSISIDRTRRRSLGSDPSRRQSFSTTLHNEKFRRSCEGLESLAAEAVDETIKIGRTQSVGTIDDNRLR